MEAQEISSLEACAYLYQFGLIDPLGVDTVQTVTEGAKCLRLVCVLGVVAVCVKRAGCALWITAAAGNTSKPMARQVLTFVERYAAKEGAQTVHFQTVRRGLVRVAKSAGYQEFTHGNGWLLSKTL